MIFKVACQKEMLHYLLASFQEAKFLMSLKKYFFFMC